MTSLKGPCTITGFCNCGSRPLDESELYYAHIDHAFQSPVKLRKLTKQAHRIDFDGGQFINTTLRIDRRNLL